MVARRFYGRSAHFIKKDNAYSNPAGVGFSEFPAKTNTPACFLFLYRVVAFCVFSSNLPGNGKMAIVRGPPRPEFCYFAEAPEVYENTLRHAEIKTKSKSDNDRSDLLC